MADPTQNSNFTRMMQIIDEVFATRNDPSQLQVNEEVIEKLQKIHPVTIAEYNEGSGPCVWVLVIPTTIEIMNLFLNGIITEQELFDRTLPGMNYEAVYLCSATALPEYRNKGLAKRMCVEAIEKLRKEYPIKNLFVWAFTHEGDALADSISKETGLPLMKHAMKNGSH